MRSQNARWWAVGGVVTAIGCTGELFVGDDTNTGGTGGSGASGGASGGNAPVVNHLNGGGAGITGSGGTRSGRGGRGGAAATGGATATGGKAGAIADSLGGESAGDGSAGHDGSPAGGAPMGGRSGMSGMGDIAGESGFGAESGTGGAPTLHCFCQPPPGLDVLYCGGTDIDAFGFTSVSADATEVVFEAIDWTDMRYFFGRLVRDDWRMSRIYEGMVPTAMSSDGNAVLLNDYRGAGDGHALWTKAHGIQPVPTEFHPFLLTTESRTLVGATINEGVETLAFFTLEGGIATTNFTQTVEQYYTGMAVTASTPDGTALAGFQSEEWATSPFLWSASGVVSLGTLPSLDPDTHPEGWPLAVSVDGTTAAGVTRVGDNAVRIFRWTAGEGMVDVAACGSEQEDCMAGGLVPNVLLSDDGKVLASDRSDLPFYDRAFRRAEDGTIQELTPGAYSDVVAMSSDGSKILGYLADETGNVGKVFIWDEAHGARELGSIFTAADPRHPGWDWSLTGWGATPALSRDGKVVIAGGRCGDSAALFRADLPD